MTTLTTENTRVAAALGCPEKTISDAGRGRPGQSIFWRENRMPVVTAHKIGSATCGHVPNHDVEIIEGGNVKPGDVIVVKALEEKRVYDQLELTTGRLAHISKDDILVGVLGARAASSSIPPRTRVRIRGVVTCVIKLTEPSITPLTWVWKIPRSVASPSTRSKS